MTGPAHPELLGAPEFDRPRASLTACRANICNYATAKIGPLIMESYHEGNEYVD